MKKHMTVAALLVAGGSVLTLPAAAQASAARYRPPAVIHSQSTDVFPHSVDYDACERAFLVGSLKHGTVSAVRADGAVRTIVDDQRLVAVQAVRADRARERILVSNVDYGLADRSDPANPFRVAGVGSYDPDTGRELWYADLMPLLGAGRHLIADVTVAPDGTAYAIDELTPTVVRIDRRGHASVLVRHDLLKGTVDIPGFLSGIGMTAVTWLPGNLLLIAKADGTLIRVPVNHPHQAAQVRLDKPLTALVAGLRALPDGSLAIISSGLLTGQPAQVQRVRPDRVMHMPRWTSATVTLTATVTDPVTSGITAGPSGTTYTLSGDLAALLTGMPGKGFILTQVTVN